MENDRLSKKQLLDLILKNEECDLQDEEIIHLLLEQNVSANTDKKVKGSYTLGQRTADSIARFTGSWVFIIIFLSVLVLWMLVNVLALSTRAFDPYPFILLNLVLSCVAAIQAPLIMVDAPRRFQCRMTCRSFLTMRFSAYIFSSARLTTTSMMSRVADPAISMPWLTLMR